MTVTPDTTEEPTETDEAIAEALYDAGAYCGSCDYESGPCPDCDACLTSYVKALEPILAEVKRQAAADALNARAKSFDASARLFRDMAAGRDAKGDPMSARIYTAHATQAGTDANACRTEADAVIASGYEWQCASGTGCCAPVPDAGDLCKECEASEYDDRWAE